MSIDQSKQILNGQIRGWGKITNDTLKSQFDALGIEHVDRSPSSGPSREKLMTVFRNRQGLISIIGFRFPKHMVYVHKGVGKGVPASKAGTDATKRKPKEWFNPVIDRKMDDLADIVANSSADLIVNNLVIK